MAGLVVVVLLAGVGVEDKGSIVNGRIILFGCLKFLEVKCEESKVGC